MGLKDIRRKAIEKMENGYIQHATGRAGDINVKNLLLTGEITVVRVIELLNKTKGGQYEHSLHHIIKDVEVHVFKPTGWYIKLCFIEPDVIFISVHR